MKIPYLDRIGKGVLIFDGAMGTYLFQKGVYLKKCFEEVCLTHPQMVLDIHLEYIDQGAQAIETNSYGANPIKLRGYNLADKTEAINQAAVRLARQAAGDDVYVAGSVGPTGGVLEPEGHLTETEARESFRAHIGALLRGGVDLILLETFQDPRELKLAVQVARELDPRIPLQAQFTFSRTVFAGEELYKKEAHSWGQFLKDLSIDVAGINLMGPADALEVLVILKQYLSIPLSVMPDSGFPKEVDGRQFYLTTPDYFADYAKNFLDVGASVIGGCCGTTPEHIGKMASSVINFDAGRRQTRLATVDTKVVEKTPVPQAQRSLLGQALASGQWVSTVELVAPLGTDLTVTLAKARALAQAGVQFINIPDGPRASARISAMVTAYEIKRATGIEPILHVATRDKNLIGLQGDLFGCEALGVRNLLLVTGDPPKVGKYPQVTGVFDVDSVGLTRMVDRFNKGVDMGGEELKTPTQFVYGCGVNPAFPDRGQELERAWKKAEAGAEFFITQPVYDLELLARFLEDLGKTKVPVILGVWPLASYRNALFLNNEVPGVTIPQFILDRMRPLEDKETARQEGIRIGGELLTALRPLIRGIQVSPPFGNIQTALEVLAHVT